MQPQRVTFASPNKYCEQQGGRAMLVKSYTFGSQSRTVESTDAEATRSPLGEKSTSVTEP
eukprot:493140-Amorphochlora_amoeboformis.AAC.2